MNFFKQILFAFGHCGRTDSEISNVKLTKNLILYNLIILLTIFICGGRFFLDHYSATSFIGSTKVLPAIVVLSFLLFFVLSIITIIVTILIYTVVLYIVGKYIFRWELSTQNIFGTIVLACLPFLFESIIKIVTNIMHSNSQTTIGPLSAAYIVHYFGINNQFILTALSEINIFFVWFIILILFSIKNVYKTNLSKGIQIGICLILLTVNILLGFLG
ncbi:MAG: hypothetical protein LBT80_03830 [Lactobacillaceae bacterium]|nr:hypothetical protein [Lactobacillaceae bacterium]